MFIFLDIARYMMEGVLCTTRYCMEQMASVMDIYMESIDPELTAEDFPPYKKKDYSRCDPATWTTQDICTRLWFQMCTSWTEQQHMEHFQTLSLFQYDIADGPEDPRWAAFLDSLPGMRGYLKNITLED